MTNRIACIGAVGLGVMFGVALLAANLSRMICRNRPMLQQLNRMAGFAFGGAQGALVTLLLLGGILVVEPMAKLRVARRDADTTFARTVAKRVIDVATMTRQSCLGSLIHTYNPFGRVPQLKRVIHRAQLASDPHKLNELLQHPSMNTLRENSSIRSALDSLASDPQIRRTIESGEPLDQQTALALMNNPALLELLDQPEFINQMSQILDETNTDTNGSGR